MTDDSKNSRHEQDRKLSANGEKPTPELTNSSTVREFIYLDLPKLFSYLSQIRGGRQLLIERVEHQFRIDERSEPTEIEAVEMAVDAALNGKVPFLAEGNLGGSHTSTSTTTSGDVRSKVGKSGQRLTVNTIHHEALRLVQDELGDKLLFTEGSIQLVDMDKYIHVTDKYTEFVNDFNKVTKGKLEKVPFNKEIARLTKQGMEGRLLLLFAHPDGTTGTSYLEKSFLTSSVNSIIDNYSNRPSVKFIIAGIDSTPTVEKIDFAATLNTVNAEGSDMARSMLLTAQAMETMLAFWQIKSKDHHLFPIAIYREL